MIKITRKLISTQRERNRYINKFSSVINALSEAGMEFDIKGRVKSIFSIRNKMRKQAIPFDEVYDIFAIRIILKAPPDLEKSECWRAYSIVTDFYHPNPDRLRDWVSTPKANGYESLHTTVMGPDGKWVEVQIRTERMDEIAEKGYAAHWKYKESASEKMHWTNGYQRFGSCWKILIQMHSIFWMILNSIYLPKKFLFSPQREN